MDNELKLSIRTKRLSKRKRPYSLNLLHRIFDRESGCDRNTRLLHTRTPPQHLQHELPMFKCLTPNFTIQNVDKPYGFIRKFTPNGRFLLSFSQDQRSLEIYEYRGVGAIADLLQTQEGEYVTAADHSHLPLLIKQVAFQRLFIHKFSLRMNYGIPGGYLNREFSIFLDNGRYVLIASMGISTDLPPVEHLIEYPDIFNETDLFFYNFYLVDLEGRSISDFFSYKYDSIQLSHNHGVSACGSTLAICSKYRQCIDLFEVYDGSIHKTYTIGPSGAFSQEPNKLLSIEDLVINILPLTHLKQRILTFLYRRCISFKDEKVRRQKLREFYRDFPKYERMIISKMQLVDRNTLLICYEQHSIPSERYTLTETQWDPDALKLYVFYSITEQIIINIYLENSKELLILLRDYCDFFRNVRSLQTGRSPSSSSNNVYLLNSFNDMAAMLSDPPLRFNPTVPINTQNFTPSPYLDCNLFLYDDRQISAQERPRISSTDMLCFFDRDTERPLFRFNLESAPDCCRRLSNHIEERSHSARTSRELVAFIYHPYEPFVISVQKHSKHYVVNFHIYNKATIVNDKFN